MGSAFSPGNVENRVTSPPCDAAEKRVAVSVPDRQSVGSPLQLVPLHVDEPSEAVAFVAGLEQAVLALANVTRAASGCAKRSEEAAQRVLTSSSYGRPDEAP
jgi:hypothetical protein